MEIKYMTSKIGSLCLTKCPFDDGTNPVYVGSASCAECRHRVSNDREKQIVVCNADEETK